MLKSEDFLRSLFLLAIALAFGLQSFRYPLGRIDLAGPGLFPLVISSMLGLVGVAGLVRAWVSDPNPLTFSPRNIGVVILSLAMMTLLSEYVNMTIGIIALVFCASLAGTAKYSVVRNLKLAAALIAVAFVFQKAFGLELHLL